MDNNELADAVKDVYYRRLGGHPWTAHAIAFGELALAAGHDTSAVLDLATANADDEALWQKLVAAATAVQVPLPEEPLHIWYLRRTEALERSGHPLTVRSADQVFRDRVVLIAHALQTQDRDGDLQDFLKHLRRESETDDYTTWLARLQELGSRAVEQPRCPGAVPELVEVLAWRAFGATTSEHTAALERVGKLVTHEGAW